MYVLFRFRVVSEEEEDDDDDDEEERVLRLYRLRTPRRLLAPLVWPYRLDLAYLRLVELAEDELSLLEELPLLLLDEEEDDPEDEDEDEEDDEEEDSSMIPVASISI